MVSYSFKLSALTSLEVIDRQRFNRNHIAFVLIDLANGKMIEGFRETQPMIIASLSKLFTSYFCLNILRSDFAYQTSVLYLGVM